MYVQERRSTSRHLSSSTGYVILNGIDLDLKTHDISTGGALIELAARHAIGEGMKLGIHLDTGHIGTAVVCRAIADEARTLLALQFEEHLPETIMH